jgi:hypothetical protein
MSSASSENLASKSTGVAAEGDGACERHALVLSGSCAAKRLTNCLLLQKFHLAAIRAQRAFQKLASAMYISPLDCSHPEEYHQRSCSIMILLTPGSLAEDLKQGAAH